MFVPDKPFANKAVAYSTQFYTLYDIYDNNFTSIIDIYFYEPFSIPNLK